MDDEDEFQNEPLIPQVTSNLKTQASFDHVLVIPSTMSDIVLTLPTTLVGHISVKYEQLESAETEGEFDEDEQLYSAARLDASRRKYPDVEIPFYEISEPRQKSVLAIVVPHSINAIAEKEIASVIVALAPSAETYITLAPCQLNNGVSINRLDLSTDIFQEVPLIRPPHFITGIGASVVSALSKENKTGSIGALVLNSEGHPGYEKVDADAIMDAASETYRELFDADHATHYVKKLSGVVRKVNSASTSGMYL